MLRHNRTTDDIEGDIEGDLFRLGDGHYILVNADGRAWQFIVTHKDKLKRLLEEKGDKELIEAFNQLENN